MPFEQMTKIDNFNKKVCELTKNVTLSVENICDGYKNYALRDIIKDSRVIIADDINIMPSSHTTDSLKLIGRKRDVARKNMPIRFSVDSISNTLSLETIESDISYQKNFYCDDRNNCNKCDKIEKCMKNGSVCSWTTVKHNNDRKSVAIKIFFDRESFITVMTKLIYFSNGQIF